MIYILLYGAARFAFHVACAHEGRMRSRQGAQVGRLVGTKPLGASEFSSVLLPEPVWPKIGWLTATTTAAPPPIECFLWLRSSQQLEASNRVEHQAELESTLAQHPWTNTHGEHLWQKCPFR